MHAPLELTCHLNLFNSLFSFKQLLCVCVSSVRTAHSIAMHRQSSPCILRVIKWMDRKPTHQHQRKKRKYHFCFSLLVKWSFGVAFVVVVVVAGAADTHYRRHDDKLCARVHNGHSRRIEIPGIRQHKLVRHPCASWWLLYAHTEWARSARGGTRKSEIPNWSAGAFISSIWWFWMRKRAIPPHALKIKLTNVCRFCSSNSLIHFSKFQRKMKWTAPKMSN